MAASPLPWHTQLDPAPTSDGEVDGGSSAAGGEAHVGSAVRRATDVLLVLAHSPGDVRVTDIARELGLSRGTVHRVLATLVSTGFAAYVPERRTYRLGGRSLEIGLAV